MVKGALYQSDGRSSHSKACAPRTERLIIPKHSFFVFKGTSQLVDPHFVSSKFLLRVRREDSSFALARLD